jgi:hypothetical protein
MSMTITDEEYERLTKRDKLVDDYVDQYSKWDSDWGKRFQRTAKPKSLRPTGRELCSYQYSGDSYQGLAIATAIFLLERLLEDYIANEKPSLFNLASSKTGSPPTARSWRIE